MRVPWSSESLWFQGKAAVDACKQNHVEHIVFSGLESPMHEMGIDVPDCDSKWEVENYVKELKVGLYYNQLATIHYAISKRGILPTRRVPQCCPDRGVPQSCPEQGSTQIPAGGGGGQPSPGVWTGVLLTWDWGTPCLGLGYSRQRLGYPLPGKDVGPETWKRTCDWVTPPPSVCERMRAVTNRKVAQYFWPKRHLRTFKICVRCVSSTWRVRPFEEPESKIFFGSLWAPRSMTFHVPLGENCTLAANQSVDCRATILFTISLNSAKVWNRGFNWPVFGVGMRKKSPNDSV